MDAVGRDPFDAAGRRLAFELALHLRDGEAERLFQFDGDEGAQNLFGHQRPPTLLFPRLQPCPAASKPCLFICCAVGQGRWRTIQVPLVDLAQRRQQIVEPIHLDVDLIGDPGSRSAVDIHGIEDLHLGVDGAHGRQGVIQVQPRAPHQPGQRFQVLVLLFVGRQRSFHLSLNVGVGLQRIWRRRRTIWFGTSLMSRRIRSSFSKSATRSASCPTRSSQL